TPIGRARTDTGADLHAPVAGRVRAIAPLDAAVDAGPMVVIESDGTDERDPQGEPCTELASLAPEMLIERVRRGGCGHGTRRKARARPRAIDRASGDEWRRVRAVDLL